MSKCRWPRLARGLSQPRVREAGRADGWKSTNRRYLRSANTWSE